MVKDEGSEIFLARTKVAPPPIVPAFNVAAGLEPEQSCKQKIRVGFGLA